MVPTTGCKDASSNPLLESSLLLFKGSFPGSADTNSGNTRDIVALNDHQKNIRSQEKSLAGGVWVGVKYNFKSTPA